MGPAWSHQIDGLRLTLAPALAFRSGSTSLDAHLLARSTRTTTALLHALFSLPTQRDASLGPLAVLPPPLTLLPREKPLPKAKPQTKWEAFAKAKGISHRGRDRDVWDDERQAFVPRWGKGGKNKEGEEAWIREIKGGEGGSRERGRGRGARVGKEGRGKRLRQKSPDVWVHGGLVSARYQPAS